MTIVSGPEQRNSEWANDTSSFGQKMLLKMGWSQGKGLGKNQQGTSTNLRAIRREEGLGLGASTDKTGDLGFSVTSRNFHGVLASLKEHHGSTVDDSQSSTSSKKNKKSKSRSLKRSESGLTMPSNRVTAGHARKMREAKDLNSKSKEDMAAIFGMKVEQYQQNSVWGRLSSLGDSGADSSSSESEAKKAKKEKKKKKSSKKSDDGGEKKRKKTSDENEDNDVQEKKKSKKSKKQR